MTIIFMMVISFFVQNKAVHATTHSHVQAPIVLGIAQWNDWYLETQPAVLDVRKSTSGCVLFTGWSVFYHDVTS